MPAILQGHARTGERDELLLRFFLVSGEEKLLGSELLEVFLGVDLGARVEVSTFFALLGQSKDGGGAMVGDRSECLK